MYQVFISENIKSYYLDDGFFSGIVVRLDTIDEAFRLMEVFVDNGYEVAVRRSRSVGEEDEKP